MWRRNRHHPTAGHRDKWRLWRLRDVTFDVDPGEAVGVVGRNGSGKSSLLRAIAGILPADQGEVMTEGRVVPLFSGSAGHQVGLSGWDNISLSVVTLGLSRQDARGLAPRIAEFCDLGDFLDAPVRTYSVGMRARLSVAIAVNVHPDVFLIDEALRAGDETFRHRTREWLDAFKASGGTTLLVSHDFTDIEARAERAIWLHEGHVRMVGPTTDVVDAYRSFSG
jgi:ABC-type polysaccharide/polyol phosphate transport system ATPase subunit